MCVSECVYVPYTHCNSSLTHLAHTCICNKMTDDVDDNDPNDVER